MGVLSAPLSYPSAMLCKQAPKLTGLPTWNWMESLLWTIICDRSGVNRHLDTTPPRNVNIALKAKGVSWTCSLPCPHPQCLSSAGCPKWEKMLGPCFLDPAHSFYDILSGLSKTHVLLHEKEKLWLNCLNYEGSVQQFPRAFELRFFYGFIIPSFGSLSAFSPRVEV